MSAWKGTTWGFLPPAWRVIRVMLVEDDAAFGQALAFLLDNEPDLEVVAQAGSVAEARQALWGGALEGDLDVAVVDLGGCPTETAGI